MIKRILCIVLVCLTIACQTAEINMELTERPLSLHIEYDLGGANQGAPTSTIPKQKILAAMKKKIHNLTDFHVTFFTEL